MGTNFYRIPTEDQMMDRKKDLMKRLDEMELTPRNIEREFGFIEIGSWEFDSPWGEFIGGTNIHLGKRASGWKFTWNFHKDKFYSTKETLLSFIRSGRIVDEYGDEINVEEFINMALSWGEPDGEVYNKEYCEKTKSPSLTKHYDKTIDGLNVSSSTEFS